jgi:ubiquinone/menaquinone biosynthesis C-methylase UbiE
VADKDRKRDKHFPLWTLDNSIRRLFSSPKRFCGYVAPGQVVADLGCGPGYYTMALAECVGPEGKVYAVDSDEKAIRAVRKKAENRGYHNIEAFASSASDLSFIKDGSVDFVLANGLLCSVAPLHHESAVNEMKRVLKANGHAYLSVDKSRASYVEKAEWEQVLRGFNVERQGAPMLGDRWALVNKKEN